LKLKTEEKKIHRLLTSGVSYYGFLIDDIAGLHVMGMHSFSFLPAQQSWSPGVEIVTLRSRNGGGGGGGATIASTSNMDTGAEPRETTDCRNMARRTMATTPISAMTPRLMTTWRWNLSSLMFRDSLLMTLSSASVQEKEHKRILQFSSFSIARIAQRSCHVKGHGTTDVSNFGPTCMFQIHLGLAGKEKSLLA
jgi:hypothetical protein